MPFVDSFPLFPSQEVIVIAIARDVVRKFRAVARKCLAGQPLGPAPPVVCRVRAGTLTLWTRIDSVGLRFAAPTDQKDAGLVVPMAAFAAIEGLGTDVVALSGDRKLQGTASWSDRGVPQTHLFTALMPGKQHAIPDLPVGMSPVTPEFLTALHECGKTAARDSGRFVLNHVQIRGKAGQVIATDAKQALILGGFTFPFERDILVPAIPTFGCRELAEESEIRVGHSATELVVACGPWSVWLPVNAEGRYPDVASILPKPGTGTAARLDESIAAELLRLLPALPGAKDEGQPVTLDLEADLVVRGSDEATGLVREHVTAGVGGRAGQEHRRRSLGTGPRPRARLPHHPHPSGHEQRGLRGPEPDARRRRPRRRLHRPAAGLGPAAARQPDRGSLVIVLDS